MGTGAGTVIQMVVRPAVIDDAQAIAEIHVRSWQAAYRGLIPSAFLDALSIEQRTGAWRQRLEGDASGTLVAEEGGAVLGWASICASRDDDTRSSTGELWAIYVAPGQWRRGVGQRLWTDAEGGLRRAGYSEVTVWVLQDNAPAIAFYRTNGFVADAGIEKTASIGGAALVEIRLRKRLGRE